MPVFSFREEAEIYLHLCLGTSGHDWKQGTHRHRRQEAKTCRNPERHVAILMEKLRKKQPSA